MNEKEIDLLCERLAEIQSDATERVVLLADELGDEVGLDRDKTFKLMLLGLMELYETATLKDYIPRGKE